MKKELLQINEKLDILSKWLEGISKSLCYALPESAAELEDYAREFQEKAQNKT